MPRIALNLRSTRPRNKRRFTIPGWGLNRSSGAREKKKARVGPTGAGLPIPSKELLLARGDFLFFLFFVRFRRLFRSSSALLLLFFLQLGADEFENREFGAVTDSPACANDARVPARTIRETRSEIGEKLLGGIRRHKEGRRLPARVQRVAFAERHHAFGNRTSRLGAKQSGMDTLLLNQVCDQIAEHGTSMRRLLPEFCT